MSLNNITLMGRLTKDPELRFTQAGKPVASFTLAVDRDYQKDEVDFIPIVAWNKTAEFVNSYLGKGLMATVKGRLQNRKWTDKNGVDRIISEVIAENVYPAEWKKHDGKQNQDPANPGGFTMMDEDDGDQLPF